MHKKILFHKKRGRKSPNAIKTPIPLDGWCSSSAVILFHLLLFFLWARQDVSCEQLSVDTRKKISPTQSERDFFLEVFSFLVFYAGKMEVIRRWSTEKYTGIGLSLRSCMKAFRASIWFYWAAQHSRWFYLPSVALSSVVEFAMCAAVHSFQHTTST